PSDRPRTIMFSMHAPAARSLSTYRVSETLPLRFASMRRSSTSPAHANRHGCELSAEGAAIPASRMSVLVCRFTARTRSCIAISDQHACLRTIRELDNVRQSSRRHRKCRKTLQFSGIYGHLDLSNPDPLVTLESC